FYGRSALIAPLALTVFMWILLMNSLKWIPIDVIPSLAAAAGIPYFKYVPTADPNATFGISIGVFFLIVFYSIKIKGAGGYIKEPAFYPFSARFVIPVNLFLGVIGLFT